MENFFMQFSFHYNCLNSKVFPFGDIEKIKAYAIDTDVKNFNFLKSFFSVVLLFSSQLSIAQISIVKIDRVEQILNTVSPKIQVINFWATWCAPCVKELPLFEKLNSESLDVKVTLINLDFAEKLSKVNSFLHRNKIKTEVLLLDEIDYNSWIDKIDPSWGGAIPATLILNSKTGKRKFVERELQSGELEKLIAEIR